MSAYLRTTRECSFVQFHPELRQAIQNYFREHALGDPETEALMCCETISEKKKAGRLASWLDDSVDTTIHTGMLLTPQWLVWVHHGDRSGTLLNAADLKLIGAAAHTSLFSKDAGLDVVGYIGDTKVRVQGTIAMGDGPATQKFCDAVKQALAKANPPVAKKRLFGLPFGRS